MDKSLEEDRNESKSIITQSSCSAIDEHQQEVFSTREDLDVYVKSIGKSHQTVVITLKSEMKTKNKIPIVYYGCERSGNYRSNLKVVKNDDLEINVKKKKKENDSRKTTTKKCNCSFKIKGYISGPHEWRLIVLEGKHSHQMGENFEGHSYVGRLTLVELEYVRELMSGGVTANEILRLLREIDPRNVSTQKTIYNALTFLRKQDMKGRVVVQQLFKHIQGKGYFERHTSSLDDNAITNIFWAHPELILLDMVFNSLYRLGRLLSNKPTYIE